jgi:selenocysteine lyase/cysteine desulfurase
MGTGAMIVNCDKLPDSLVEGGTGSNSYDYKQPTAIPDRYESGTPNFPGIIGLSSGVSFARSLDPEKIYNKEIKLIQYLYDRLSVNERIILYTNYPDKDYCVPVLSFNIKDYDSEYVTEILNDKYSVAVRAGLHCAPLAHKAKGTLESGTVRVVPSVFTTKDDINRLVFALNNI